MSTAYVSFEERVRVPSDAFDLQGFRRWVHSDDFPERGKISFIDGEVVVDMSPEEIDSHSSLKSDLHAQLWVFVRQNGLGRVYPDRTLLINESAGLSAEPDMMFCGNSSLESKSVYKREFVAGSGRYVELVGSPDLVVEIISRYSVRKDTELLREKYFTAGIAEYWLIDARGENIEFKLLTRGGDGFVETAQDDEGYRRSDALGASFLLTRQWNEISGFDYTLHER
jgi:Uma2 family endonuclease